MPTTLLMIHPTGTWGGGTIAFFKVAEAVRSLEKFKPILLFGHDGPALQCARREGFTALVASISTTPFSGILVGKKSFSLSYLFRFVCDYLPAQKALKQIIADYHVDVVYISTSVPLGTANMAKRQNLPIIIHVREFVNELSIGGQLARSIVQETADIIITNSVHSAKPFAAHKRVYPIYDGVPLTPTYSDTEKSAVRRKWGINGTIIGMISPLIAFKGHITFIEAIPSILQQQPDARFVIVGSTPLPSEYWQTWRGRMRHHILKQQDFLMTLKEKVFSLGLKDYVVFDGWRNDIPLVLSAIDILVFPSLIPEGFGRPIAEAGSACRPIVASDIGPASELIETGKTGMLFPPGDANALATCVLALLKDPALAEAMGQAGRERVVKLFSDERHRFKLRELFKQSFPGGTVDTNSI